MTCQACHGPDGNSPIPTFPIIAGQHKDYLLHSMLSYKTGERTNPIMVAIVQPLSEEDIEDLAAYYAVPGRFVPDRCGLWVPELPESTGFLDFFWRQRPDCQGMQ